MCTLDHRYPAALLVTALACTACGDVTGPGGKARLAFLRYSRTMAVDWQIYTIGFFTGDATRVTQGTANRWVPAWSPDGAKLAFDSDQDSTGAEIFVMNADGSLLHRVTNILGPALCPGWSPDGSKIIFDYEGTWAAIYSMNSDGTDTTRLVQRTHPFYRCP